MKLRDSCMSKKKECIIATILTLVMAFIEMSALPMVLFCKIEIADIQPIYIALILNFLIAFCICFILRKMILKDWIFGLTSNGVLSGLKKIWASYDTCICDSVCIIYHRTAAI